MKKLSSFIIALVMSYTIAGTAFAGEGNTSRQSLNKAKKILIKKVYRAHQTTFYCGCRYSQGKVITDTNGYVPKYKRWRRAHRLEWEQIVPVHDFGQSFTEWSEGHPECVDSKGEPFKERKCARKVSIKFRYMESDMYNLVPAVGEINALRSNYSFGIIPGERREFGECDMEIKNRKVEPSPNVRGDIARIYFYMEWAYPEHVIISKKNQRLFKAWDKNDPVDAWECERCKRIEQIQGNDNPFVKRICVNSGMW